MVALGLDFGTESCRALVVDVATGEEKGSVVVHYAHGVIDERLPESDVTLGPDWALQHPNDWLVAIGVAVPEALRTSGVDASDVIGIGVDFTSCTVLPTFADGTPLCLVDRWRSHPHSWPKLWKHHAAHAQAERITSVASERGEPWLARVGGRVSSEWMHSKVLQILEEAPDVYSAAERVIEGGDWIVWQLTGVEIRNATAAGYKSLRMKERGYPSPQFLAQLDPRLERFHLEKTAAPVLAPGADAGGLTAAAAELLGLREGTPVAVATIDAHASVPGAGITGPGSMVLILGTSTCHMLMSDEIALVPGIGGIVEDGIVPGLVGYEAGQAGVGDMFDWYVHHGAPTRIHLESAAEGLDAYAYLEREAAKLAPGESGLIALDWWNGNRSVLTDASLSGLLIGATLGTRPHEIFRALIEATAFGTRVIIEAFERGGVEVRDLVACGGLAVRNRLLLQIYADVAGREIRVAGSSLTSGLGAAMLGATAAGSGRGGYDSIAEAAERMSTFAAISYTPNPAAHSIYDELYAEYLALHDYFGRGGNDVMKRLRKLRDRPATDSQGSYQ